MHRAQIMQVTSQSKLTQNDLLHQLLRLLVPQQDPSVENRCEIREDIDDLRRGHAIPIGEPLDDDEDAHVAEDASEEQYLRDELEDEVETRPEVDRVESLEE